VATSLEASNEIYLPNRLLGLCQLVIF